MRVILVRLGTAVPLRALKMLEWLAEKASLALLELAEHTQQPSTKRTQGLPAPARVSPVSSRWEELAESVAMRVLWPSDDP